MSLSDAASVVAGKKSEPEKHGKAAEINDVDEAVNESSLVDSDVENSSVANKIIPFKKPRVPLQQVFSVSFQESYAESYTELEITKNITKTNQLFKQRQSAPDPFNTFYSETDDLTAEVNSNKSEESIESESSLTISNKSNPFTKLKKSQSKIFDIDYESSTKADLSDSISNFKKPFFKNARISSQNFQISFNELESISHSKNNIDISEKELTLECQDDSVNVSKRNPFRKAAGKSPKDAFQVELQESTYCSDSIENSDTFSVFKKPNQSNTSFDVTYCTQASQKKVDSTGKGESINTSEITIEKNGIVLSAESDVNKEIEESIREEEINIRKSIQETSSLSNEIPMDKSAQNVSSTTHSNKQANSNLNSETYLDESSYNDDNLKYWMSDHSDEEILPPSVPAIPNPSSAKKISPTSQKTPSKETSSPLSWEQKFNQIVSNANKKVDIHSQKKTVNSKKVSKKKEVDKTDKQLKDANQYKPPTVRKPAPFATKRLYHYITNKLNPKFGIDSVIQAEELVSLICETVKVVTRRKTYQKTLVANLKKEMALAGIIDTTVDFYEFVIKYLPYNFRIKVVPCLHPVTNSIFPPRSAANPFDKIL